MRWYIEDYACLWIQAIREYHDHTGDPGLARELWLAVVGQLQWLLERRTERGLVKARDFVYPGSNPLCYQVGEGATLNAFVARALEDAAYLARRLRKGGGGASYALAARDVKEAVNQHLWDEAAGTYLGGLIDGRPHPPTVPAAFLSLHFGTVPPARRARMQAWLLAHHAQHEGLPYSYQFLFKALHGLDTPEADRRALALIRQKWGGHGGG